MHLEPWLGHLLHTQLGGEYTHWATTIGRVSVLLFGIITLWGVRRVPYLRAALLIWCLWVALQALDDLLTNGADLPYTVYALGGHLTTTLIFLFLSIYGPLIAETLQRQMQARRARRRR